MKPVDFWALFIVCALPGAFFLAATAVFFRTRKELDYDDHD